jgi:hypothetical protein
MATGAARLKCKTSYRERKKKNRLDTHRPSHGRSIPALDAASALRGLSACNQRFPNPVATRAAQSFFKTQSFLSSSRSHLRCRKPTIWFASTLKNPTMSPRALMP